MTLRETLTVEVGERVGGRVVGRVLVGGVLRLAEGAARGQQAATRGR